MYLDHKKHIHFIGIGGSGMFPLAQILHSKGYYLTGSDNNETDTLQMVREMGIPVTLGQKSENIRGADLIVHTAAIMDDNPELIAARASGVPTIERSVLLGEISAQYADAVCISGTHGKTTTTSMTVQILLDAGLDPTCVIGGKLPAIHGGGRAGRSETMVCEACEFVDTFLKLYPDIAVILNIDADHLDYFKTMENLIASFHKFASKATRLVIANGDDKNTLKALEGLDKPVVTFGYSAINDYYPTNIEHVDGVTLSFDLCRDSEVLTPLQLHIPGDHNILNAIAACIAAHEAGASWEQCARGLDAFHGAQRRFEVLGEYGGITVADDYGHHPTEITATLTAAKKLPFKRVWAVHQPFTYSRTAMLLDDFVKALSIADRVVLSEIMGSREKNTYHIYAKDLAERIPGCVWFPEFSQIAAYVVQNAQPGDLIITLGCGDVNKCAHMMANLLREKYGG